jgi:hypothetical protein
MKDDTQGNWVQKSCGTSNDARRNSRSPPGTLSEDDASAQDDQTIGPLDASVVQPPASSGASPLPLVAVVAFVAFIAAENTALAQNPSPPTDGSQIVYLAPCNTGGSELDYYPDYKQSQNGQLPAASAVALPIVGGSYPGSGDLSSTGTFSDGNHFSVYLQNLDHVTGTPIIKGLGFNDFKLFTCRLDNFRVLYSTPNKVCNSLVYCQP